MTAKSKTLRAAAALAFACAIVGSSPALQARPQTASPSSTAPASSTPTAAKKKTASKKHHHSRHEPSQKAPTADRISEIQSALARGGYYQGDPNGKWDSNTVAAMQKFQSAQGLEPTGKLDALSLQKLGLGSDVAGVSAPKTTPPPAAPAPKPGSSAPPATPPQPQKTDATASAAPASAAASSIPQQ